MNNEPKEAERVAFEAWARPVGFYLTRNEILGHYANIDTTRAWEGWQARAALAQQDAQVPRSTSPTALRPYDPTEQMRWAAKQLDPALTHEQIRALWCAMWSAAPTPPAQPISDVTEAVTKTIIEVEKLLCEKLGRQWSAAGISIASLVDELAARAAPTPPAAKDSGGKPHVIVLTTAEIQSGLDRVRWAELLIRQLPENHDGRNSWLMNYGTDKAERQAEWSRRTGRPLPDHQVQHLPSDDTEGGAI